MQDDIKAIESLLVYCLIWLASRTMDRFIQPLSVSLSLSQHKSCGWLSNYVCVKDSQAARTAAQNKLVKFGRNVNGFTTNFDVW